jgi:polyferredoxin
MTWIAGMAVALTSAFPAAVWAGGTHGGQIVPLPGTAVDELSRYRLALAFGVVALAIIVVSTFRRSKGARAHADDTGLDVLALPGIGRFLLWRGDAFLLQLSATVLFIVLIVAGLALPASQGGNLASSFTWSVWWPGLAILTLLAGRIWCLACPPAAIGDWVQRLVGLRHRLPRVLQNSWLQIGILLAITWAFTYWDIAMGARGTAVFLLAFTLVAVAVAVVFERRTFCRYLCPISGMLGLFGMLSPWRLAARRERAESDTRPSAPRDVRFRR